MFPTVAKKYYLTQKFTALSTNSRQLICYFKIFSLSSRYNVVNCGTSINTICYVCQASLVPNEFFHWFSTFLKLWPYDTVPHVIVMTNQKIIFCFYLLILNEYMYMVKFYSAIKMKSAEKQNKPEINALNNIIQAKN